MVDYCTYHSDCGWVGVQPLQHELEEQDSALSSVATPAAPPDTTDTVPPTDADRRSVALTPRFSVRIAENMEEPRTSSRGSSTGSQPSLLRRLFAFLSNFFRRNN